MSTDVRVPRGSGDGATGFERENAVLGRLHDADTAPGDPDWDQFSPGQQACKATLLLEECVLAGGFEHYFFSSSAALDDAVRDGLNLLGTSRLLAVFDEALEAFPDGEPPTRAEERQEFLERTLEDVFSAWHELDERFTRLNEGDESLLESRLRYVDEDPEEFFLE